MSFFCNSVDSRTYEYITYCSFLLLTVIEINQLANCTAQQDCDSCSATDGCGWFVIALFFTLFCLFYDNLNTLSSLRKFCRDTDFRCAPTQQCLAGNVTGPSQGQCLGSSWEWKRCTPCQALTDCRSCLTYDQVSYLLFLLLVSILHFAFTYKLLKDCFWCATANGGAGGCKNIGFFGCPYTKTCREYLLSCHQKSFLRK